MDYVRPHYYSNFFFIISLISLFVPRVTIFAWPTERRATEKFVQVYKIELSDGTGQQGSALERSKVRCGNWHLGLNDNVTLCSARGQIYRSNCATRSIEIWQFSRALHYLSRHQGMRKREERLLVADRPATPRLALASPTHSNKGNNTIFYSLYCFSQTWLNSFDFTNKINLSIKK